MQVKRIGAVLLVLGAVGVTGLIAAAQDGAAPATKAEFIGAPKCIICHKKDGTGPSWQSGVHAKAWEVLSPEQQKNEACIACHATGKTATGELLTAVQCEACHGAGSLYKAKAIMESREKSIANGLIVPDEKTCGKCHNDKTAPECKAKPFVYKEAVKKGVHAMVPDSLKKAAAPAPK